MVGESVQLESVRESARSDSSRLAKVEVQSGASGIFRAARATEDAVPLEFQSAAPAIYRGQHEPTLFVEDYHHLNITARLPYLAVT